MIERAGNNPGITLKLCMAIFHGEEIPEDIGETDEEFVEMRKTLLRNNLPASTSAVLRSRREIVQHAKAASYIINQLYIRGQDLSEDIILQTHGILTHKVDAKNVPWQEYSGIYRKDESDLQEVIRKSTIDPIAIATKYTHIFVNIHPFIDGNGRMCHLILNSMLLKLGSFLVGIGALEQMYEDRYEEEKPVMHAELGSFVMAHVRKSMRKLLDDFWDFLS
ncbi:uncharacterized protein KD926_008861 [Aspergillus affinis]|uniref:uncharacterized protein n=1 Tax=Aspergillus affinis TaxID=1070780 RepID=UPI0022FE1A83|nr:uncharacterized protein KD926_008861 [Aspergillus affinis]KAI9045434.1 hypothetical protein KD926_008861 [Aspergillus affinis]